MKIKLWKDLTAEEKEKLLKRICGAAAVIFVIIFILLLMKCEGCSSESKRQRKYADGRGHAYGEELYGTDIFNDDYGKGVEDYTLLSDDQDAQILRLQLAEEEKIKAEEEERIKAEKEAAEKAAFEKAAAEKAAREKAEKAEKAALTEAAKKAEAEMLAKEEKARKAEEEKKRKAEAKKAAEEEKKKKAEAEAARKLAESEKKKADEAAKKKADEERRKAEAERQRQEEEKRKAEEAKKKELEKRKIEESKAAADRNNAVLLEIIKKLLDAKNESEKQKLLDQGVELAKKMIEEGNDSDAAHYLLAQDAQKKKDYYRALDELKKAIAQNELNYLYWYDKGKIEYLLRRYEDARDSFKRSIELNDHFSPSVYNLGLTYVKLSDENNALTSFKKSVEINPEYEKGYIEQARVYNRLGKLSECVKAYDTLIKLFPDNNAAIMELGSVYYQYGKYDESEALYKKALEYLEKSEQKTLTAYNLSKVLYDDGKYSEASRYGWIAYDEKDFLLSDLQKANVIYNYALIQEKTGRLQDAKRLYYEAIKINPAHIKSKVNLSAIFMAEENADADKAIELLLDAYKTDSKDFSVNNNLGTAYMVKEDYATAEKYYKAALDISPEDEDALLNLANALVRCGKPAEAVYYFDKVTNMNSENLEAFVGLAKAQFQTGDTQGAYKNLLYVRSKDSSFHKAEVESLIAVLEN